MARGKKCQQLAVAGQALCIARNSSAPGGCGVDDRKRIRMIPHNQDLNHDLGGLGVELLDQVADLLEEPGRGTDDQRIADRLGHSSTKVTEAVYARLLPKAQAEVAQVMDRLLTAGGA